MAEDALHGVKIATVGQQPGSAGGIRTHDSRIKSSFQGVRQSSLMAIIYLVPSAMMLWRLLSYARVAVSDGFRERA